jgi:hypothetical protein
VLAGLVACGRIVFRGRARSPAVVLDRVRERRRERKARHQDDARKYSGGSGRRRVGLGVMSGSRGARCSGQRSR